MESKLSVLNVDEVTFLGCKDIVEVAVARSIEYLGRAGGILDRDDLYNQSYLMVLEQFERWNPEVTTFRKYLYATLALRLRRYIDSFKYHGKEHRCREVSVSPSEFSGNMEDVNIGDIPRTISVEERLRFSTWEEFDQKLFVTDLLSKLPDRHRFILEEYLFKEKTFDEIGQNLRITSAVVSGYFKRTIRWLRRFLEDPEHPVPFQTALTREEKVVHKEDIVAMVRFFGISCTEDDAVSFGFSRRVWRHSSRLLREAGCLQTKALHGGGRRSFLTVEVEECLKYVEKAFSEIRG